MIAYCGFIKWIVVKNHANLRVLETVILTLSIRQLIHWVLIKAQYLIEGWKQKYKFLPQWCLRTHSISCNALSRRPFPYGNVSFDKTRFEYFPCNTAWYWSFRVSSDNYIPNTVLSFYHYDFVLTVRWQHFEGGNVKTFYCLL